MSVLFGVVIFLFVVVDLIPVAIRWYYIHKAWQLAGLEKISDRAAGLAKLNLQSASTLLLASKVLSVFRLKALSAYATHLANERIQRSNGYIEIANAIIINQQGQSSDGFDWDLIENKFQTGH